MSHMRREDALKIRDRARAYVTAELRPFTSVTPATGTPNITALKGLGELGMTGLTVPPEYGGFQSDARAFSMVVEEVARACPSTAILLVTHIASLIPLARFGSREQKSELLPRLAMGERFVGFSASNVEAESFSATTDDVIATRSGNGWTLNGLKLHVTGAHVFDGFVVLARNDHADATRYTLFWVERTDPGVSIGKLDDHVGLDAVGTGELHFKNCQLPPGRVIGSVAEGAEAGRPFLPLAMIGESAIMLAVCEELLRISQDHLRERILSLPRAAAIDGPGRIVAAMESELVAMRLMQDSSAYQYGEDESSETMPTLQLKSFLGDAGVRVMDWAARLVANRHGAPRFEIERLISHARALGMYHIATDTARGRLAALIVDSQRAFVPAS